MTIHRFPARSLVSLILLFVLISLACNAPFGSSVPEAEPEEPAPAQEAAPAVGEDAVPADAQPAEAEPPQADPPAEPAPEQAEAVVEEAAVEQPAADVGFSFENPYPVGTIIETPYWDVQVLAFMRGEPAYQRILQDRPDLEAAPPGMEYVVLHMVVRNKFTDEYSKSLDLSDVFVAGDQRLKRKDGLTDVPSPEIVYTDTYSAEELDAWQDALVEIGDSNLVLVWQPNDGTDEPARYLALEEGAAPGAPPELAAIAPNDMGLDPADPAPFGQTVVTEEWEVTVLDVLRDEPAADLFWQLFEGNEVDEGMDPTLVNVRVRYLGEGADYTNMSVSNFAAAQDAERVYEGPRYKIWNPYDPPWMQIDYLPGGEHEGWMILQSPAGESGVMLRFKPDPFDPVRYMALEP